MKVKSFIMGLAIAQLLFGFLMYLMGGYDFERSVINLLTGIGLLQLADLI